MVSIKIRKVGPAFNEFGREDSRGTWVVVFFFFFYFCPIVPFFLSLFLGDGSIYWNIVDRAIKLQTKRRLTHSTPLPLSPSLGLPMASVFNSFSSTAFKLFGRSHRAHLILNDLIFKSMVILRKKSGYFPLVLGSEILEKCLSRYINMLVLLQNEISFSSLLLEISSVRRPSVS